MVGWRWASRGRESKGQTELVPRPAGSTRSPDGAGEEEQAQHPLLQASSGEQGKE